MYFVQVEAKHEGTSFILNVGDNFYRSHDANGGKRGGVDNVTDHIWETTFVDMYTGALAKMPILSILGNHDYMGNTSAQVEYGCVHTRLFPCISCLCPHISYCATEMIGFAANGNLHDMVSCSEFLF